MLNEDNESLYESVKVKDFVHRNEMSNLRKGTIIKRANERLKRKMERLQESGQSIDKDEMITFVDKQIGKLDQPEKKKKEKPSYQFKTLWGENIYRQNAFLGAEVNKMKSYSKVNKALITFIHNREKMNKEPSKSEIDSFMQKQIDRMDKTSLNEAEILRRFSIPKVLEVLRMESKPIVLPFREEEDYIMIMLEVQAKDLSYKETRVIRETFATEDDGENNTLFLEVGALKKEDVSERDVVKTSERASLIVAERCLKEWTNEHPTNTLEIKKIMDQMENDYNLFLKKEDKMMKEVIEKEKIEKRKLTYFDILIRFLEGSVLGYVAYLLYQHFK